MLVILDACSSGLAVSDTRTMAPPVTETNISDFATLAIIRSELAEKARNILVAGTGDEPALAKNGGIFTKYVISGLKGDADLTQDGVIQFEELQLYLKNRVEVETAQMGLRQTPNSLVATRFGRGRIFFLCPALGDTHKAKSV